MDFSITRGVHGPSNTTGLDLFTRRFIYNDILQRRAHTVDTAKTTVPSIG